MSVTSGTDGRGTHVQQEDNPWAINIVNHPNRAESGWFRDAKRTARKILATLDASTYPYGPGPWEMHHGGSLWVLTDAGWRMYLARAAIEWSLQFCADPAKVDRLRRDAKGLVGAFPQTIAALEELGYTGARAILDEEITDADGVARFTDSLFNSCVPLTRADHQGVLPRAAGEHYYPIPIKDGDFIRYDDFKLWVTIEDGTHAAFAPVAPRGSGDGHAELLYARHGTAASEALSAAMKQHKSVIAPPNHRAARTAFKHQR
jgi:Family of unknown function (DUF6424)